MKYCENCGAKAEENARFCTACGAPFRETSEVAMRRGTEERFYEPRYAPPYYGDGGAEPRKMQDRDTGSGGFGVLGFFFPIVGLILFLIWHETYPKRAKGAGLGALIATSVKVAIILLYVIIAAIIASALA